MPDYQTLWKVKDEVVQELRSKFLAELEESDPGLYHPDDIERVKENDWFVTRYFLHQGKNIDRAFNMMKESLKWRKEFQANTLARSDIPIEFFHSRATFIYKEDKQGHPVIMIRTKMHVKDDRIKRLEQLYTIYWVEKALKNSDWNMVCILFDCTDTGVSNVDLDMLRFIVNLFKKYYPCSLACFIVYNMPWYLSGIWKIIKPWIPEQYVNRVKFSDQNTITDHINPDQLPIELGGTCTKLYEPKEGAEVPNDDDELFTAALTPEVAQC